MVEAVVALAVSGLAFGALLGFAAKKFAVEVDPRAEKIRGVLPGANCGACGYPGCSGLADAIAAGKAPIDACTVGKGAVAKAIAEIMGQSYVKKEDERLVARVLCMGGRGVSENRFRYDGIRDCKAALLFQGGPKACEYGCLGFGSCVKACRFDALSMGPDRLPVVDASKCTACGKCVSACPRGLIALLPESASVYVRCLNKDPGAQVRKACKVGCIACRACVRACKYDAVKVESNLAVIDYSKCTRCGECVAKCPTKCIFQEGVTTAGAEVKAAS